MVFGWRKMKRKKERMRMRKGGESEIETEENSKPTIQKVQWKWKMENWKGV